MTGKSLKARAADKDDESVKKTDLYRINPLILEEEEGFNLRDYEDPEVIAHIEGFCQSYMEGRYVPPLVVRTTSDGRVIVVEGHCRRKGARLAVERGADLRYVDVLPFKGSDDERVEVMLDSQDGLKLKPLQIADGYLRLHRMGHSNAQIAKRRRKTGSHVEQMLLLAQSNHDVRELVRKGVVAAYPAIEAIRQYKEKAGDFLLGKLDEAKRQGKTKMTRSALREWAPPRKVVSGVIGTVGEVVAKLDSATRLKLAEFEGMEPGQLEGKTVQIDAASLLELVRAHSEVVAAQLARERAAEATKAAAAQQQLDVEPDSDDERGDAKAPEAD